MPLGADLLGPPLTPLARAYQAAACDARARLQRRMRRSGFVERFDDWLAGSGRPVGWVARGIAEDLGVDAAVLFPPEADERDSF